MITMNSTNLRTIKISQRLFHSLRLRNIISIKSRNNLPPRLLKRKVQSITLTPTHVAMEDLDPRKPCRIGASNVKSSISGPVLDKHHLQVLTRIVEPRHSVQQPANNPLLVLHWYQNRNIRRVPVIHRDLAEP